MSLGNGHQFCWRCFAALRMRNKGANQNKSKEVMIMTKITIL